MKKKMLAALIASFAMGAATIGTNVHAANIDEMNAVTDTEFAIDGDIDKGGLDMAGLNAVLDEQADTLKYVDPNDTDSGVLSYDDADHISDFLLGRMFSEDQLDLMSINQLEGIKGDRDFYALFTRSHLEDVPGEDRIKTQFKEAGKYDYISNDLNKRIKVIVKRKVGLLDASIPYRADVTNFSGILFNPEQNNSAIIARDLALSQAYKLVRGQYWDLIEGPDGNPVDLDTLSDDQKNDRLRIETDADDYIQDTLKMIIDGEEPYRARGQALNRYFSPDPDESKKFDEDDAREMITAIEEYIAPDQNAAWSIRSSGGVDLSDIISEIQKSKAGDLFTNIGDLDPKKSEDFSDFLIDLGGEINSEFKMLGKLQDTVGELRAEIKQLKKGKKRIKSKSLSEAPTLSSSSSEDPVVPLSRNEARRERKKR